MTMVIIMIAVMMIGISGLLKWSSSGYRNAVNRTLRNKMLYTAEAGIQFALASFHSFPRYEIHPTMADCSAISNVFWNTISRNAFPADIKVDEYTVCTNGTPYQGIIEQGAYKGMRGFIQQIAVRVGVYEDNNKINNKLKLTQTIDSIFISIFQFGVFYEGNLEIHPGAQMSFVGPVHGNNNIYLSTDSSLQFNSYVTAAGSIYHKRLEGTTPSGGQVYFKDSEGFYQPMNIYGIWLDSDHPFWTQGALLRWDGNVRSEVHQTQYLSIPIPGAETNAHVIVEKPVTNDASDVSESKYYNKASLKILDDGKLYGSSNTGQTTVDYYIADIENLDWIIMTNSFWNGRQGYMINPVDIDMDKFNDWILTNAPPAFTNNSPNAGIMYLSRSNLEGSAFRIINGSKIPVSLSKGLSIASPNAMYIKGNYNNIQKRPCSILSDSLTVLSEKWNDKYNDGTYSKQKAGETIVNAAIMTGNVSTDEGDRDSYSGGLENFPRFLEDWSSIKFYYTGSLVCLWNSICETEVWKGYQNNNNNYYNPPTRIWQYDTAFSNPNTTPPGTPNIHVFEVALWKREY